MAVIACKPRVYPEAEPAATAALEALEAEPEALEAEPEATVALDAGAEPEGSMALTVDAGDIPRSADAGSTVQDASTGGSNSRDQVTVVVVGRGGVFVGGDNSGVITVTNDDSGCTLVRLFRDRDGDGFGSNASEDVIAGCPPMAGFAREGGDCHDAPSTMRDPSGDVFPGQTRFFTVGYPGPNGVSFDYDCSGSEEADPGPEFVSAPTDCEARGVLSCSQVIEGYLALGDARSGPGVSSLCGTRERATCSNVGTDCASLRIDAGAPFPCH
jgi:hypothetical protein